MPRMLGTKLRRFLPVAAVALQACTLLACGGPTAFSGRTPLAIQATPPPPPPPPLKRVVLHQDKIEIKEKIQFDFNKATIKEVSFPLLAEVAQVIKDHPEIRKVSIEGHASSEGSDQYNLDLSDKRSKSVMEHLVTKGGVEAERLTARGFGETVPISTNDSEEGREKNRRVEFNIVERDPSKAKPADTATAPTKPADAPTNPTAGETKGGEK